MELAIIGSGSKGNCSLVRHGQTLVMIDCGFSLSETEARLATLGVAGNDLSAILVTHEHSDHIAGVAKIANKYALPLYLTHGTKQYFDRKAVKLSCPLVEITLEQPFILGDIVITPVPVPHDAKEPCQFVFECDDQKLGVLSDLGHISAAVEAAFSDCDLLFIECNHDRTMLAEGPYPAALKARVSGNWGHLSNCQTAQFLAGLTAKTLRRVIVGHMSEINNAEAAIKQALSAIDMLDVVHLAPQHEVQAWLSVR